MSSLHSGRMTSEPAVQPQPHCWGARRTLAAAGVAAVIGGVGGAAIYAATEGSTPTMGSGPHSADGPPHGAPPPGAPHPAPVAPPSPAGVLHSEYVVPDGHGGFTTKLTQTGTVDEVTLSNIVVRSDDGYTADLRVPVGRRSVGGGARHRHRRRHARRPDGDPHQHRPGPTARELAGAATTARSRQEARPSPPGPPPTSRSRSPPSRWSMSHPASSLGTGDDGAEPLSSLNTMVNAPIATTALAPTVGRHQFQFLRNHSGTPFQFRDRSSHSAGSDHAIRSPVSRLCS